MTFVRIALEREVKGTELVAFYLTNVETLETLSCGPGAFFESILGDLKSELEAKEKVLTELQKD